jgi:hypothetical protein
MVFLTDMARERKSANMERFPAQQSKLELEGWFQCVCPQARHLAMKNPGPYF